MITAAETFAECYAREWLEQPLLLHQLGQDYLPQIPGLPARLGRDGARVADVGCGVGWSAIAIARAYPSVTVEGFDLDAPSIDTARRNAAEAGVAERVHFAVASVGNVAPDRPYDAVFAFECLHDLADPIGVLTAMRRLAGSDGIVIVLDERPEDPCTIPLSLVEQLACYTLICYLPDRKTQPPSAATVTVLRADPLTDYAARAGFDRVEELALEHDLFHFYRMHH